MIITKLKQFIIFNCDQNETPISTLLTQEVRNKIFTIEKVSTSGLNFRTWSNTSLINNYDKLTPNTIYLVTTKPGQTGYEIPGAVDAENYCPEIFFAGLYTKKYIGNFDGNPNWFETAVVDTFVNQILVSSDINILNGKYYAFESDFFSINSRSYIKFNKLNKKYEFIIPHCASCNLYDDMDSDILDCGSCIENYNNIIHNIDLDSDSDLDGGSDSDLDSDSDSDLDSDDYNSISPYVDIIETPYIFSDDLLNWEYANGVNSNTTIQNIVGDFFNYSNDISNNFFKNCSIKMDGFFKPKISGSYKFEISGSGKALLWIKEKIEYTTNNSLLYLNSETPITVESEAVDLIAGERYVIKIQYYTQNEIKFNYKINNISIQKSDETLGWGGTLENNEFLNEEDEEDIENILDEDMEEETCETEEFIPEELEDNFRNKQPCESPKKSGILVIDNKADFSECDCYKTSSLDPSGLLFIAVGLLFDALLKHAKGVVVSNIKKLNFRSDGYERLSKLFNKKIILENKKMSKIFVAERLSSRPHVLEIPDDLSWVPEFVPIGWYIPMIFGVYKKSQRRLIKEYNSLVRRLNSLSEPDDPSWRWEYERNRITELAYQFEYWQQDWLRLLNKKIKIERREKKLEECYEAFLNKYLESQNKLIEYKRLYNRLKMPLRRPHPTSPPDYLRQAIASILGGVAKFFKGETIVTPKICQTIPLPPAPGLHPSIYDAATPEMDSDNCECEECPIGFTLAQGWVSFQGSDNSGDPYCFNCNPDHTRCGIVPNFVDPVSRVGGKCSCNDTYELKPCLSGCDIDGQYVKCGSVLPPDCLNTITCINSKFRWDDILCDWVCKEDNCSSNEIQDKLNCNCINCENGLIADKASNSCICPLGPNDCMSNEYFDEALCACLPNPPNPTPNPTTVPNCENTPYYIPPTGGDKDHNQTPAFACCSVADNGWNSLENKPIPLPPGGCPCGCAYQYRSANFGGPGWFLSCIPAYSC